MATSTNPVGPAEARLIRLGGAFTGSGALFYATVSARTISDQSSLVPPWWTPCAAGFIVVCGLGTVAASIKGSIWALSRILHTFAIGYVVILLSWLFLWNGQHIPAIQGPWFNAMPGLGAIGLGLFRRWPTVVAYSLGIEITAHEVNVRAITAFGEPAWIDILLNSAFIAIFALAVGQMVKTGRVLDQTLDETRAQISSAAASESRALERERFKQLTHDGVLAALITAMRAPHPAIDALTRRQAVAALAELRALEDGTLSSAVHFADFVARIRASVALADDLASIDVQVDAEPDLIPAEVSDAMASATLEAVRNVLRHSRAHEWQVSLSADFDQVRIQVSDNGIGFDPRAVPRERMGLAVSVHSRLHSIDGGWSRVTSEPGIGTMVELGWIAV